MTGFGDDMNNGRGKSQPCIPSVQTPPTKWSHGEESWCGEKRTTGTRLGFSIQQMATLLRFIKAGKNIPSIVHRRLRAGCASALGEGRQWPGGIQENLSSRESITSKLQPLVLKMIYLSCPGIKRDACLYISPITVLTEIQFTYRKAYRY